MAFQSHAALAEIRDTLLETYASNDAMNQPILAHLDPRAWRAQAPGQKGHGRTIADIFAHLHNTRRSWLRHSAPHLKCPPPLDPDRCTMKQATAAHRRSAAQCLRRKSTRRYFCGNLLAPHRGSLQRRSWYVNLRDHLRRRKRSVELVVDFAVVIVWIDTQLVEI